MKLWLGIAAVCLLGALVYSALPEPERTTGAYEPIEVESAPEQVEGLTWAEQVPELPPIEGELAAVEELGADEMFLSGRVNPVSGAQPDVHLVFRADCEEPDECTTYETDADPETGDYAVALSPGTWRIVARADGYVPATEEGIVLTEGESLGGVDLTLQPGERITGTVRLEEAPAEGVTVAALADGWERHGITDAWGHFEIEGLPRGEYTVRAYQSLNGGDEIKALTGSTVSLTLGYRVKVRGRVRDARGVPVEGATVFSDFDPIATLERDPYAKATGNLFGLGMHGCGPSPGCYQRGESDSAGFFEVEMAPGETLSIGAKLGNAAALVEGVSAGGGLVELTLQEPKTKLRLLDVEGRPMAGEQIEIEPTAPFFRAPLRTDAAGWLTLPPVAIQKLVVPTRGVLVGDRPDELIVESAESKEAIID